MPSWPRHRKHLFCGKSRCESPRNRKKVPLGVFLDANHRLLRFEPLEPRWLLASDFGDAPDPPFSTLLANSGAEHVLGSGLTLGSLADADTDGQPNASATGDDNDGTNDDDGVTFGTMMVGQLDATVTVNVQGSAGNLDAWIDFNGDGSWGGPVEQIFASWNVVVGDNLMTFDVPSFAIAGTTYAGFRLSTAGGLGQSGVTADGEVEDYQVTIAGPSAASGVFIGQHVITAATAGARSVFAADVDGDMDVVSALNASDRITWYRNNGNQSFSQHFIDSSAQGARMAIAGDFDGDGDIDVVGASAYENKVAWYINDPFAGANGDADGAYGVFAADVDGDGDLDVLSASSIDDKTAWYENTNQTYDFTASGFSAPEGDVTNTTNIVTLKRSGASSVPTSVDVVPTGVTASADSDYTSGPVTINFGVDEAIKPVPIQVLGETIIENHETINLSLANTTVGGAVGVTQPTATFTILDDDFTLGDFGDAPAPYPTTQGEDGARHLESGPTLGATRDAESDGMHSVAADADGADDDGVLFGPIQVGAFDTNLSLNVQGAGKLDAWIDFNDDGNWGGPGEQIFDSASVSTGDNLLFFAVPSWAADGDTYARFRLSTSGDLGLRGLGADGEVEDYQVTVTGPAAASGLFTVQNTITTAADSAHSVIAADVDGDGDADVLSASSNDDKIAWHENDGSGNFTSHTISTNADAANSVFAADVDGDGDLDVFSASSGDDKIAWYENDGDQRFTPHTISTTADGANDVFAAAVDGDGDLDVLSASGGDDKIAWYEQVNQACDFAASEFSTAEGDITNTTNLVMLTRSGAINVTSSVNVVVTGGTATEGTDFTAGPVAIVFGASEMTMPVPIEVWGETIAENDETMNLSLTNFSVGGVACAQQPTATYTIVDDDFAIGDFGDAPAPYPTTLAENGARHLEAGPMLGATRDVEADGTHSSAAAADGADEDGVTFSTIQIGALDAAVTVDVQGTAARLDAWIDFNGDGSWGGSGEQIFDNVDVSPGGNALLFDVPSWAAHGATYARFRLSTTGDLAMGGLASDGEVEDY